MALNRELVGRAYVMSAPYEVSRVKIAEFATAIGDPNPVYYDKAAAVAAGHPDVIAPPTFPTVIGLSPEDGVLADPELGLDFSMVVHGEQRFEYERPIYAGDELHCTTTITEIRGVGRNEFLSTRSDITSGTGELICRAHSVIVQRGGVG